VNGLRYTIRFKQCGDIVVEILIKTAGIFYGTPIAVTNITYYKKKRIYFSGDSSQNIKNVSYPKRPKL